MLLFIRMLPPIPIPRAFLASKEPNGAITVRRVSPLGGVSDIFTFKDEVEMRVALSESHSPPALALLFHELTNSGSAIFHAVWIKGKLKKSRERNRRGRTR
jgi:hypothetical protein